MALQDDLNRLQKQLGNFLFPRKCPFCGTVTGGRLLCGSCERTLPYTGENALRQGTFGRCASPLYYTGPVREAILRFKFQGRTGGLDCFGRLLADCAARWYPGEFDTVTWVPVSRKRLRQRGFDQSRLLAASLCVDWHVAPVETLRKAVDNPAQSGLTDAEHRPGQRAGSLRGPAGERPGQASPAHRRYRHHRLHPHRVRPGAAGGRGRRRGVPDAGPHRGGALIKGNAACGETPPVWKCRKRRTIAPGLVCGGM